jgi:hypothetical protein
MFNDSKYSKWYFSIVENAKKRNLISEYETHHITPRSMGGADLENNLVKVSYREHFICHLLLTKMCLNKQDEIKMLWALHRLTFSRDYYSSYQYELARKKHVFNMLTNHPSKKQSWRDLVSIAVFKTWENNEERREQTSIKMKERWDNDDGTLRTMALKNLPDPMIGKENPVVKEIEYYGKIYYGWRELYEGTNVSKHLYNKYYVNGVDPSKRIGANGPTQNEKGESV